MTTLKHRIAQVSGLSLSILAAFGGTGLVIPAEVQAQAIQEIVVTARRKEENLKEVPLSITAFDSGQIESAGITNLGDVADLTPGLSFFNAFGENLPVPVIRGIVPQDIFGENATAIFVDGVYVSGRAGLNFAQLDLERIEVLKGPQSAMYGRNAFAGALNYVTKAPPDVFEAKSEVEGGSRGKQRIMGQVGGPILGESLTGRISAMYDEWDGSYDNTLAGGDDIGGYRYRSFQGRLRWRPADTIEVNLGLYYSNDEIDDPATGGVPANCEDQIEQTSSAELQGGPFERLQNWCGAIPKLASLPDALDPTQFPNMVIMPNSITKDSMPKNPLATGEDRDLIRGNFNISWDTDFGTLNLLTGYSDTEQSSVSDFNRSSGISLPLVYCPDANTTAAPPFCNPTNLSFMRAPMGWINIENGGETEEWSQEVRFTSPQDQQLRYAVGAYYFDVNSDSFPGAPVATNRIDADFRDIGIGPIAYPTSLAIGSYIFAGTLAPVFDTSQRLDGAIDPLTRITGNEKSTGWSVFGSMDFDITEKLTGGAEIRYSQDKKEQTTYDYAPCGNPDVYPFNTPDDIAINPCDSSVAGDDAFDLRVTAPCVRQYDEAGDYSGCTPGTQSGTARFDYVTGRLSLKYLLDSGWNLYGAVAWGEKPGGLQIFNAGVVTATGTATELVTNSFDPEKITTYEVGMKGFTEDRRVSLDMSLFFYDWTDIVFRQLQETSSSGQQFEQPTSLNINAGDAEVWGWEMLAEVAFTDNWTGRFSASWTDSTLTDARMDTYALFPSFYTTEPSCAPAAIQALPEDDQGLKAAQCRQLSGDVTGNTQMRQPEWTASASLTYQHELAGDWDWSARIDGNYLDKIYVGNDNQTWLPSRTNVNFRLGFDSPRYSVEFWVRNLLDNNNPIAAFRDIYWTNDADIQGQETLTDVREASNFDDFPPLRMSITYPSLRTYGVVGKIRFGGAEN